MTNENNLANMKRSYRNKGGIMSRRWAVLLCAVALAVPSSALVAAPQGEAGQSLHAAKKKIKSGKKHLSRKAVRLQRARLHKAAYRTAAPGVAMDGLGELRLASAKAMVVNQDTGAVLYAKGTDLATPIASVTKLMTAMVVLDAHQPLDEMVTITKEDVDTIKGTGSRLRVGTALSRQELLQLALMASENRAASALGNAYPGGRSAFIDAMNAKAAALGMTRSHFVDGTGLDSSNVSTAEDLARMARAAYQYAEIRQVSTSASYAVPVRGVRHPLEFRNTNALVRNSDWQIGLSKTGYISESGRCLVMQAQIADQPLIIVLLDSWGKYTRIGDAQRIRKWLENSPRTIG